MSSEEGKARYLFFSDFRLDCRSGELQRGGRKVRLQAQPAKLLVLLATRAGEVVTRPEIQEALWGDDTFVDFEHGINFSIKQIRTVLADNAENPRYVETVPRAGYRFIASTEGLASAEPELENSPYPGLLSFTEGDAEFFFGREEEVQTLWSKLERGYLLALIGPSGAGKSSLLQAGLLPASPPGWAMLMCRPQEGPFRAVAQALGVELPLDEEKDRDPDPEAILARLQRWRATRAEACLCIDAFEELFTLNDETTRTRFSELVGKAAESGIHVLLAMRDDFFVHCHDYPGLERIFDQVTPLKPPRGPALRRALVEPARKRGYRFEDDALVAEILSEVTNERGALPLLAFAAARLWEKRDRSRSLLTRKAYLEIGGVGGALAQHAEATLAAIGPERQVIVREILRNLTTARGTRAAQDRDEILSVFEDGEAAATVLRKLIDARLLTLSGREVEIIHESLLQAWPRLVQWQAQDAEGRVFRDQLRQAARAWQERGRPDDLLWMGSSLLELRTWRARYPGRLSALEEAFAEGAARLAGRKRRRRRIALAGAFAVLLGVVGVVTSLWRRTVLEVSRREAAQILALGRLDLADRPTAALGHALASLERADSEEARRFALEALWHGAAAFVLPDVNVFDFSADGRWLATGSVRTGARLWSMEGGPPRILSGPAAAPSVQFGPTSELLAVGERETAWFYALPEGREIRHVDLGGRTTFRRTGSHLFSLTRTSGETRALRDWIAPEEVPDVFALVDLTDVTNWDIDASGERLATARGNDVYLSSLRESSPEARLVGKHDAKVVWIAAHPTTSRVVSSDESGEVRIWSFSGESGRLERTLRAAAPEALVDKTDSWMVFSRSGPRSRSEVAHVSDLTGPPDAEPIVLRNGNAVAMITAGFDPAGRWLFTVHDHFGILWPLYRKYPHVIRGQAPPFMAVAFTPDGSALVSTSDENVVRLWPLSFRKGERSRVLMEDKTAQLGLFLEVDPSGKRVLVGSRFDPRVFLVPLDGGAPRQMPGFTSGQGWVHPVAFSPDGRLGVAAGSRPAILRIWDLETGALRTLDLHTLEECAWGRDWEGSVAGLEFLADGRLVTVGAGGVRVWDLDRETSERIRPCTSTTFLRSSLAADRDRRRFLTLELDHTARKSELSSFDLATRSFREITSHGNRVSSAALDSSGTIVVTGDFDGVVRVGPITGEAPHLLLGHELEVTSVAVSPTGEWIASAGQDGTIRLWPMPEGKPFHTLPYEELLERLRSLTNLRVVSDESSGNGYRVEIGPFPGWENVPIW